MSRKIIKIGLSHLRKGELDEADSCFNRILSRDPRHHYCLNLSGLVAMYRGDYEQALSLINRALRLAPAMAMYYHNIAVILGIKGDFDLSYKHFRHAIRNKPDYAEAFYNFAQVCKFEAADPVVKKMESLLSKNSLKQEDLCFLHFAAGKIYDDLQEFDKAFYHYSEGNRLKGEKFSAKNLEKICDAIVNSFNSTTVSSRLNTIKNRYRPIFIVGMPRSGTTLVEQILSSHADVAGAGELNDMTSIANSIPSHHPQKLAYPYYIDTIADEVLAGFAKNYMQSTNNIVGPGKRAVDKMPNNFFRLGLIRIMFPMATIIHCRRNKIDTCLSCYFQRFKYRQEFSYSLENLASYYKQYERMMRHWTDVGVDYLTLDYENLVTKPEDEAKKLIEYCGLAWDAECMNFYNNSRPVTTASYHQVRQPIYNSSLWRWRRYESHIGSLVEALK